MTSRTPPRRGAWWPARLLWGLVLAVALLPQVFLNTGIVERLIAGDDHRVRVAWDVAWMTWPGRVHVRGLELEERRAGTTWLLRVGSVTTRVSLSSLLHRELRLRDARAQDVSFFLRGDARGTGAEALALPLIQPPPGRPQVLIGPPSLRPHGDERGRGPWTFHFDGFESDSVREVWIGPYRLLVESGMLRVSGVFQPGRRLLLREVRFEDVFGEAWRGTELAGGRLVDADIRLRVRAQRGPDDHGLDVQHGLSGTARLRFVVQDLGYLLRFANPGVLPAEALHGGAGEAWVSARFEQGQLLAGSVIRARGEQLAWELAPGTMRGSYALSARLHEDPAGRVRSQVFLGVDGVRLENRKGEALGTAPRLEILGEALQGARLGEAPTNHSLSVRLVEPARVDLYALNPWLGGFLRFRSGVATLALDLGFGKPVLEPLGGAPRSRREVLDLRVEHMEASLGETPIRGRLRAHLRGSGAAPRNDHGLMLGRLRISLDGVSLGAAARPEVRDWSGSLTLEDLALHASPPSLETTLHGELDSAAPVVHLLIEQGRLPRVLRDLLAVPDVKLDAHVLATPRLAKVRGLRLEGRRLWAKGEITAHAHRGADATLLVRVALVPAGVEVRRGQLDLHLFGPYSWFESQQRAAPRAGRSGHPRR